MRFGRDEGEVGSKRVVAVNAKTAHFETMYPLVNIVSPLANFAHKLSYFPE